MPIHERTYRRWQGNRRGRLWRSLVIARCGVAVALKRRSLIVLVLLGVTPATVLAALVYHASRGPDFARLADGFIHTAAEWRDLVGETPAVGAVWSVIFGKFLAWQLIPVGVIATFVGPELISQDLRYRALQVYYSRPLTRSDYVLGKLMVVAVFVAMVTLVPAMLLYVVAVILEKSLRVVAETWPVICAIVAGHLLITLVTGVPVLACSSLSRRSGYVAAAWAALLIASETAHGLAHDAMAQKWSHLLSIRANTVQVLTRMFGTNPAYDCAWFWSLAVLAAVWLAALSVLARRVRLLEGQH
jgi:ABC-2 type transport system permease protein